MYKKSFKDIDGKSGTLGSEVIEVFYDKERGEHKTVKEIISKGRGGTRIYFENGGFGNPSSYRVIKNK